MTNKELSEALGAIDEKYVTEAMTFRKKRKLFWIPIAVAAACLCLISVPTIQPTAAESPDGFNVNGSTEYYTEVYGAEGTDLHFPVLIEGGEALEIQQAALTLNLQEFPRGSDLPADFFSDSCSATMEFSLYNPTDEPLTVKFTLPCGSYPRYVSSYNADGSVDPTIYQPLRDQHRVFADGVAVDTTLRITATDTLPAAQGEWSAGYFSNDTTVSKYTYQIGDLETEEAYISLWGPGHGDFCIMMEGQWGGAMINGYTNTWSYVCEGDTVTLYVFGDAPDYHPAWRFYSDWQRDTPTTGTAELVASETMTFLDFAAESWEESWGVTMSDWACALGQAMKQSAYSDGVVSLQALTNDEFPITVQRWYEYELTIQPGETVVNTIMTPAFPGLFMGGWQQNYNYALNLLSLRLLGNFPAQVTVVTPLEMTESSVAFTQTESGYFLDLEGLYGAEITFTLSSFHITEPVQIEQPSTQIPPYWIAGCIVLAALVLWLVLRQKKRHGRA